MALDAGPAASEPGSATGLGARPLAAPLDVEAEPKVASCQTADAARRAADGQEPASGAEGEEPAELVADGTVLRFVFPGAFDSLDDTGA